MAQRVNVEYVQYYTYGNAAKRIAPAITVHTGAIPQIKKRKIHKVYVDPIATLGIVVAVCMLIMMAVGVSHLQKEQQATAVMEQYVQLLQQENESLQAQYNASCDLEAVRSTALALGMIPKEEANTVSIQIELPEIETPRTVGVLSSVGIFFADIFA